MRMARAIFWSPLSDSKFLLTVVLAIARTSTYGSMHMLGFVG